MTIFKNRATRALILTMGALVSLALVVSGIYYKNVNASVDPRIVEARKLYENYNLYAQKSAFDSIFRLMDEIEAIYSSVDHYQDSYEIGVLYNNRAATLLTIALYSEEAMENPLVQDSLMTLAMDAAEKSIEIYRRWLEKYPGKNKDEIERMISNNFLAGLEGYDTDQKEKFLKNRVKEIVETQTETERRLSVSYNNQGIIYRHKLQYEEAAESYKMAIDLWDRNLTAENNLNVLLGRPIRKQNFIQKMFPPEKN